MCKRLVMALAALIALSTPALHAQQPVSTSFAQPKPTTAAWTSATSVNQRAAVQVTGMASVTVTLHATSTMTAGAITFEVDDDQDNTTWYQVFCTRTDSFRGEKTFTLAVTDQAWSCPVTSWTRFNVRLSTVITGSGTASLGIIPSAAPSAIQLSATLAVDSTGTAIPTASVNNGAADSSTPRVAVSDKGANTAANAVPVTLATDRNFCADGAQVQSVKISQTSTQLELVAVSGSTVVYICGFDLTSAADVNAQLVYGTGTNCGTGETDLTGTYQLTAASGAGLRGIVRANGGAVQAKTATGQAVCLELSAAVQVDGMLTYVQR